MASPKQHLLSPCHAHNVVQVNTLHSCCANCRSNHVLLMNKFVLLLVLASCSSSIIQEHEFSASKQCPSVCLLGDQEAWSYSMPFISGKSSLLALCTAAAEYIMYTYARGTAL